MWAYFFPLNNALKLKVHVFCLYVCFFFGPVLFREKNMYSTFDEIS